MRFTPQTDAQAEAQSNNLLEPGIYDYEVRECTEETSQAGNEMLKLEIWVFDHSGSRRLVWDYLVSTEKALFKVKQFAESCGMDEQYKTGMLMPQEIVGRTGKLHLIIRPAREQYGPSNSVRAYLKPEDAAAQQTFLAGESWASGGGRTWASGGGSAVIAGKDGSPQTPRKPIAAGKGSDLDDEIPFGSCWQ